MTKDQVTSTEKHLTKIIEFRQQVYTEGLSKARDAQFDPHSALVRAELIFIPI